MTHNPISNPISNTTLPSHTIRNIQALAAYISHSLHTVLYQIDASGHILASYCDIPDFSDTFITQELISDYVNQCITDKIPLFFSCNDICYALVCPSSQDFGFLIGPFRISSPVRLCHTNTGSRYDFSDLSDQIPVVTIENISEILLMLHNLYSDNILTGNDISLHNLAHQDMHLELHKRYTNLVFENQENTIHHNPYSQEVREQKSIEDGDLEALKNALAEDYSGQLGILSKDPVRNMKNLGIVLVTLASRSAMRGGLPPEIAYSLSDSYIQQIDEMDSVSKYFFYEMEYHYTALVKEAREQSEKEKQKNPHIEKCKDFIFSHLHDRITVETLASEFGYNPDYLSHLFKKSEGIGISQYIIREKISRSQNLLIYTNYTYSEIATYLGFSSQSHFSKYFKIYTGQTPHQFRISQRPEDFFKKG